MATGYLECSLATAKNSFLSNSENKTNVVGNCSNRNFMFYGGEYNQFASPTPNPTTTPTLTPRLRNTDIPGTARADRAVYHG